MIDNFLNSTGLAYFYNRIKALFASQADLDTLEERVDSLVVPTAVSELTNDSGFQTAQQVSDAIGTALDGVTGITYSAVDSLPATGEAGVIYLVPNSGSGQNVKDEYIWTGSAFEKIGTTETDLSGYWQTADLVAITTAEIDAITAA